MHSVSFALLTYGEYFIFQRRDAISHISSPGRLALFGGHTEGSESPLQAMYRELAEETNIKLSPDDLEYLGKFYTEGPRKETRYGYVLRLSSNDFDVYEGSGKEMYTRDQLMTMSREEFSPTTYQALKLWVFLNGEY